MSVSGHQLWQLAVRPPSRWANSSNDHLQDVVKNTQTLMRLIWFHVTLRLMPKTADKLAKPIAPLHSKEEVEVASDIELCVNKTKPTYKGSGVMSTFCAAETHELR